nr:GIY-YIG nuclease family protein [Propionicimonas sp.]
MLRRAATVLPAEPGVYRFRDDRDRVIYVGRATDLRSRVRSYAGDLADRPHLRRMAPQVARVEALVCASAHEAAWLERNLLERSLPRWNRVRGGMELVGWLVVRADAGRPGLDLVIDGPDMPCAAFGPYLGVERLAIARSALLRTWPLPLAGNRLDAADRSLAEARGVGPGDRGRFADRLRAVLEREPAAVAELHDLLLVARDRAVAQLAFETAAQVQAEVAAVDWLVSPQRVTGCTPGLVVSGWADDVLVTLRTPTDRLDHWTARRTPQDAGERAANQTPPEWREFATRNATLAAALLATAGAGDQPSRPPPRDPGSSPG